MTKGDDHETALERLNRLLVLLVPPTASVRCQNALTLPDGVPEPDFVVCTPPRARRNRHPRPADVFVVVEVADSSLRIDRTDSLQMYAENGIPEYWIVNLVDNRVEVYTGPAAPPGREAYYQMQTNYVPGQHVPVTVAGVAVGSIAVDAILP